MRSRVAEFPNDNPALHGGTTWIMVELCGAPVPELQQEAPMVKPSETIETIDAVESETIEISTESVESAEPVEEADEPIEIVDEFEDFEVIDEPADPFTIFLGTLEEVAVAAGG